MGARRDIDAGRLSARLVLERPEVADDGQGGGEAVFVEQARLWALVEPVRFDAESRAAGRIATVTHQVTMRARGDLRPGLRLRKANRVFAIEALRDPDETGRLMLALCREVTG